MKYKEVEFKYNANNLALTTFQEFAKNREPAKIVLASGYDTFYENQKDVSAFCRLRSGPDMHQVTFKRKLADNNNYVRTEHNADIARTMTEAQVEDLLKEFGYAYNSKIFKNCFVYQYDTYTLVYYICYDLDLKELGRFVEIEMNEEYPWKHENDAWNDLVALERLCKPLGISPQARIKRSLFELFRKDNASK